MKPVATLYCLADEAYFRLLLGRGREIEEILTASADAFEDVDYEFAKRGRNRSGSVSFGHETRSEAEIERPRLARHVMRALQDEWATGKADQIVLAAGPKMLGALRDAVPAELAAHIAAELAKDLSDIPACDLPGHLPELPNL